MANFFKAGLADVFIRNKKNNDVLDGVRAIAILYVVLFHTFFFAQYAFAEKQQFVEFINSLPAVMTWVWHGDMGVDIFFVLSGFLIGQYLMREVNDKGTINLKRFYYKRVLRILPLYAFAMILLALGNDPNAKYFWANLLLINNLLPAENIFIPWSWSLTIEGQFYLLVPFLTLLLFRLGHWLLPLLGLFVIATVYRYFALSSEPIVYQQTLLDYFVANNIDDAILYLETIYITFFARFGPLILGLVAAYADLNYREKLQEFFTRQPVYYAGMILLALGLIYWSVSYQNYNLSSSADFSSQAHLWHTILERNIFALGFVILMMAAIYQVGPGKVFYRFFSLKLFVPIAQTSYSLYLFHPGFIFIGFILVKGDGKYSSLSLLETGQVFGLALGMAFIFAIITFVFIERPFMQLGRRKE